MTADSRLLSETQYRLLFDEAHDGLFVSTPSGRYVDVNRSGHTMLGYEPGELIGMHIDQVILPRDVPRLRSALTAVTQGHAQTQIWPMVRKDGSMIELEVLAQRSAQGRCSPWSAMSMRGRSSGGSCRLPRPSCARCSARRPTAS